MQNISPLCQLHIQVGQTVKFLQVCHLWVYWGNAQLLAEKQQNVVGQMKQYLHLASWESLIHCIDSAERRETGVRIFLTL